VCVAGETVFRGYFPEWRDTRSFETADAGWLDEHGQLTVTGRRDAVVITGGEKVQPAEVEALLRDTGEFPEIVVLGVPDTEWGQMLVAAYPATLKPRLKRVADVMTRSLAPHKRPKLFVPLDSWPANGPGKVNRAQITSLVIAAIHSGANAAPK
jgi:O-succinylbenzoic acid--CoA ligase